jgi:hypothetical protein
MPDPYQQIESQQKLIAMVRWFLFGFFMFLIAGSAVQMLRVGWSWIGLILFFSLAAVLLQTRDAGTARRVCAALGWTSAQFNQYWLMGLGASIAGIVLPLVVT